jgi:tRNA-specific 2-thiouridylase
MPFVDDFQSNIRTPNPDVTCNSQIKFNKFRQHVLHDLEFDCMATGHYVRVENSANDGSLELLRGEDDTKDQSYFLATTAVR